MTQAQKIYQYMKEHGSITSLEATNRLKIMSPNRVISNLRNMGYDIITEYIPHGTGHPFAVWRLA